MKTLTRTDIKKMIKDYLPVGVEFIHTTAIRGWLLENVCNDEEWIRADICGIIVKSMAKQGFFTTYRNQCGTVVYIRN